MADASAEPGSRLSGRRAVVMFAALGLVLAALAVTAGFLVRRTQAADTRESDIQAAQSVARRVVANFYSIGYQTFDQDAQRVYADLSDTFRQQAVRQLGSTWKQTVVGDRLLSRATVSASGLINISDRSAEVIVTVRRISQSAQVKQPVSSWQRAQVQLAKIGGRWRVSGMGALQ